MVRFGDADACVFAVALLMLLIAPPIVTAEGSNPDEGILRDVFDRPALDGWRIREGEWAAQDGRAVAVDTFGVLLRAAQPRRDFTAVVEAAYVHTESHAASGLVFRFDEASGTGYAVGVREVERGTHPQFGAWERPVLQLHRWDRDGWKLLQESKIERGRSGALMPLKVICRGPHIWVFCEDMQTPVLTEHDGEYDRSGAIGLWKDHRGRGIFDNFSIAPPPSALPPAPLRTDWSWVRGAVYVRSNAVNSVQMWQDYWDHTAVIDRELGYARLYGFNMVQIYLHWIVWERHSEEYLKRIDDFLARAARHGLKANLILWDDCGHVEPSLNFAEPVPGRHNSQMMPNPSHAIRDSEPVLAAHEERFKAYVEGVAARFKDDERIAFWQLYNEGMGPREKYRQRVPDANLNRLLDWTRRWVKGTGTQIPVTATGGAFYGPKYSDFYTYHAYAAGDDPLPSADGGREHLCTETLNRPNADLEACVNELAGKNNGFVVWELMIGRDNCRFPWGHPDGPDEPAEPFHGVVYPDGHPWSVREVKALLGDERFAAMKASVFEVEYFTGNFKTRRKRSITPAIDFDLGDEPGYGSPDASARIEKDDFSMRWTGKRVAPASGRYTFFADSDGQFRVWVGGTKVIDKAEHGRGAVEGTIDLVGGEAYPVVVEYIHKDAAAAAHVHWAGPGFERRILNPGG